MAVFGLVKDLASRQSVVNRYMDSYSWSNVFCMVLAVYLALIQPYNFISRLHSPFEA